MCAKRIVPFHLVDHISHLELYISSMEKLVVNFHSNGEKEVASAFTKFAEFSKELLTPIKNLVREKIAFESINKQKKYY